MFPVSPASVIAAKLLRLLLGETNRQPQSRLRPPPPDASLCLKPVWRARPSILQEQGRNRNLYNNWAIKSQPTKRRLGRRLEAETGDPAVLAGWCPPTGVWPWPPPRLWKVPCACRSLAWRPSQTCP